MSKSVLLQQADRRGNWTVSYDIVQQVVLTCCHLDNVHKTLRLIHIVGHPLQLQHTLTMPSCSSSLQPCNTIYAHQGSRPVRKSFSFHSEK